MEATVDFGSPVAASMRRRCRFFVAVRLAFVAFLGVSVAADLAEDVDAEAASETTSVSVDSPGEGLRLRPLLPLSVDIEEGEPLRLEGFGAVTFFDEDTTWGAPPATAVALETRFL